MAFQRCVYCMLFNQSQYKSMNGDNDVIQKSKPSSAQEITQKDNEIPKHVKHHHRRLEAEMFENFLQRKSRPRPKPDAKFERAFSFTGYDIMKDVEPVPVIVETDDQKLRREQVELYKNACKMLGILPTTYVTKHLFDKDLVINSHPLGPDGTRALCIALVDNIRVLTLNINDNGIGPEGTEAVAQLIQENDRITELYIAVNNIGTRGLFALSEALLTRKYLTTLDLSGNQLDDADSKYIAQIITFNKHLETFNISHNKFGERAGFEIGKAIAKNDTLSYFDISWNHIRGKAAIAFALGIKRNVGLKTLNFAWNGLYNHGSLALGKALSVNRTLKELNVSSNRIDKEGIFGILKGLQKNETLRILRIGHNSFSPEIALGILKAIEKAAVVTLDLSDTVVREDFVKLYEEFNRTRITPLRVLHGAVVKATAPPEHVNMGLDWRDPVTRMYKFMQDNGYRVLDLLKRLDRDQSFSVDRAEFKNGLIALEIPMTEGQLDEVIERLDVDKDGEVDLAELIQGEKDFKKKMRARIRKMIKEANTLDPTLQKLKDIDDM